jgi:hypothetical protein
MQTVTAQPTIRVPQVLIGVVNSFVESVASKLLQSLPAMFNKVVAPRASETHSTW